MPRVRWVGIALVSVWLLSCSSTSSTPSPTATTSGTSAASATAASAAASAGALPFAPLSQRATFHIGLPEGNTAYVVFYDALDKGYFDQAGLLKNSIDDAQLIDTSPLQDALGQVGKQ